MAARGTPSARPREQLIQPVKKGPPGADSNAKGDAKTLPHAHQARKQAARPDTTSTTAPPTNSRPAAAPSARQNHAILTHKATSDTNILYKALQNEPVGDPRDQPRWFDGYDSLDRKLLVECGRNKPYERTQLAHLEVLTGRRNGAPHNVGLQDAIRDTISYLLDVEAERNPVTAITSMPQGVSRPLWDGKLYLGGIKDSGNVNGVLDELNISAVVSIHPTDWLTNECWRGGLLYEKWDGDLNSPQFRRDNPKRLQYQIELHDDSSSDILAHLRKAIPFMNKFLIDGDRPRNVLVHCKMGQSRSASVVLAYMCDRYFRTHLANMDSNKRPSRKEVSEKLQGIQGQFLGEFALPADNKPLGVAPRSTASKRRGVSTKKFDRQLLQYAQYLAEGEKGLPPKPPKPAEAAGGGGIIKGAAMVLCFMCRIVPSREILGYWSSLRNTNTHYWRAASQDRALKEGIHVEDHLATFNQFFEQYWKPSQQGPPPT
ncbi:hypothetical protein KVR01_004292 [Diaporthe batatas]|uniref:uncharacterized protein n=1 Tax=Diaporthe batatas TaxID=748121 RepID=UPI001D03CC32|nr:uncharacterized protein KVR01_004292 [Diaporthe batatas]KAG8165740.1 hypothetical protein KVR01_004292 [Diaporthe batatas]